VATHRHGPRLSAFAAVSVDGYLATTDNDLSWLDEAASDDTDYGHAAFMADVDAVAMGRHTYAHIASLDPLPFADRPVFVFTSTTPPPRPGVRFWAVDPRTAVAHWHAQGLRHVCVDGGVVVSDFLAAGLLDELTLFHVPVLLGAGRRLFVARDGAPSAVVALQLDHVDRWPSGMVVTRYRRPTAH
jgi:dihydrofolate reductase